MFFVLCVQLNSKCISDGLMHFVAWHHRTPESKFTKFWEEMSIGQTPNRANFCDDLTRNVQDISDQIFVLLIKWTKVYQNFSGDAAYQSL